ncbi:MAG: hypothetical protein ACK5O1_07345 [Holosporales bacterium]|jgi:hypothetical protein
MFFRKMPTTGSVEAALNDTLIKMNIEELQRALHDGSQIQINAAKALLSYDIKKRFPAYANGILEHIERYVVNAAPARWAA